MNDHLSPSLPRRILSALTDRWQRFWDRRPLRRKAFWALIIGGIGTAGIELGIPELVEISETAQRYLTGIWGLLIAAGYVDRSERDVTPVSDPRSNQGAPLIEFEENPIP